MNDCTKKLCYIYISYIWIHSQFTLKQIKVIGKRRQANLQIHFHSSLTRTNTNSTQKYKYKNCKNRVPICSLPTNSSSCKTGPQEKMPGAGSSWWEKNVFNSYFFHLPHSRRVKLMRQQMFANLISLTCPIWSHDPQFDNAGCHTQWWGKWCRAKSESHLIFTKAQLICSHIRA